MGLLFLCGFSLVAASRGYSLVAHSSGFLIAVSSGGELGLRAYQASVVAAWGLSRVAPGL